MINPVFNPPGDSYGPFLELLKMFRKMRDAVTFRLAYFTYLQWSFFHGRYLPDLQKDIEEFIDMTPVIRNHMNCLFQAISNLSDVNTENPEVFIGNFEESLRPTTTKIAIVSKSFQIILRN